jgi:outer membrane protein TolC
MSTLTVELSQPLLRGAGQKVVAENLKQSERDVIYAIRSFSQFQKEFALGIVVAYFELLQEQDQLRNAYADYQRRLETIRYTEARGEGGRQSQLEVDEARTEELTAKNTYITTATTYLNSLDDFKILLGVPLTTNIKLDDEAMVQLRKTGLMPLDLDRDRAFHIAVEHHLELLNDVDRFEDSKRKIYVAANALKADLRIFGRADLDSQPPTDYAKFNFNDVRAGAGIELDLPLDRLTERNRYRATLINFERSIRSLGLELDNKKNEIDRGLRNLELLRRSYYIQTNSVTIAERRVEGEQLSLQAGRRSVLNVRDAQTALVDAQNDLTDALIGHLRARLQLAVNIGILNTDVPQFWFGPDALTIPLDELQDTTPETTDPDAILPPEKFFAL